MKKLYLLFLIMVILISTGYTEDLQIPYIENITASGGENSITLFWNQPTSDLYTYRIYRNTEIINNNNFPNSELIGEASTNINSFTDFPDTTVNFYYAVLAADSSDNIYKLFIPYNNITTSPAKIDSPSSLLDSAANISSIKTSSAGNSIVLNYSSNKENRTLLIFRSGKPISDNKSLAEADFLSEINSSNISYSDFPLPGTLNYYAILDSELYKSGRFTIIPGGNSTIESSEVVTGDSEAYLESRKSIRNNPLPFLEINKSINTGKPLISQSTSLPVKQNLSFRTTTIINKLINSIYTERKELLTPVILSKDLETSENSEEYQLKKILLSDFKEENWPVAYRLLSNFLSVRHAKDIELRAHFYRAQVLFFQKKYRDSFMEFILADDELREEIKPWQDQILIILR